MAEIFAPEFAKVKTKCHFSFLSSTNTDHRVPSRKNSVTVRVKTPKTEKLWQEVMDLGGRKSTRFEGTTRNATTLTQQHGKWCLLGQHMFWWLKKTRNKWMKGQTGQKRNPDVCPPSIMWHFLSFEEKLTELVWTRCGQSENSDSWTRNNSDRKKCVCVRFSWNLGLIINFPKSLIAKQWPHFLTKSPKSRWKCNKSADFKQLLPTLNHFYQLLSRFWQLFLTFCNFFWLLLQNWR